jgi:hypothetical protein
LAGGDWQANRPDTLKQTFLLVFNTLMEPSRRARNGWRRTGDLIRSMHTIARQKSIMPFSRRLKKSATVLSSCWIASSELSHLEAGTPFTKEGAEEEVLRSEEGLERRAV